MKKLLFLALSIFLVIGMSTAQKSHDNSSKKNNNDKKKDNTNGDSDPVGCNSSASTMGSEALGSYQTKVMNYSKKDRTLLSLEIMAHAGATQNFSNSNVGFYNAIPRVKMNYGALSAEARFDVDVAKDFTTLGKNIDALLQFNLIPSRNIKVIFGQGTMYAIDSKTNFHESFLGLDFGMNNKKIIISPELRYTHDWKNNTMVYFESGLKASYRVLDSNSLGVYFDLGASYKKLSTSGLGTVYGGFNFMLY